MNKSFLVLDASFLAHRAFHATGSLSHGGEPTEVVFGLLRDATVLAERFDQPELVWCFDVGKGLREQRFPWYKETRRTRTYTDVEAEARDGLKSQLEKLRTDLLPRIGYRNVFGQKGYEADDVMAAVCHALPEGGRAVLVSADKDLWQLLGPDVAHFNPITKVFYTAKHFKKDFGVHPTQWPRVKAIAGCKTDDVPGIDGVGEITAARHVASVLSGQKVKGISASNEAKIRSFLQTEQYTDNLVAVKLPYPGCLPVELHESDPDPKAWRVVCEEHGALSLLDWMDGGKVWRGER